MTNIEQKTILIAGGSGMIGGKLRELLINNDFKVTTLTRSDDADGKSSFHWNPEKKEIDENAIRNADVIINLAGESITGKRWTHSRKRKIVNSRIFATNLLTESLKRIPNKVKLVVNASAIGIYGDTGELIMNETSPPASDFLGKTCQRWEAAAHEFENLNIRTVIFRIGLVLAEEGGFLPEIRKPLYFGLAPYLGKGTQYQSWIHVHDVCRMIVMAIQEEKISGVYNAVAPGPLSNKNLMILLTHIIGKKFFLLRIPGIFVKIMFGEMSKIVLTGTRVSCRKIESAGFSFSFPQASQALRDLLDK